MQTFCRIVHGEQLAFCRPSRSGAEFRRRLRCEMCAVECAASANAKIYKAKTQTFSQTRPTATGRAINSITRQHFRCLHIQNTDTSVVAVASVSPSSPLPPPSLVKLSKSYPLKRRLMYSLRASAAAARWRKGTTRARVETYFERERLRVCVALPSTC